MPDGNATHHIVPLFGLAVQVNIPDQPEGPELAVETLAVFKAVVISVSESEGVYQNDYSVLPGKNKLLVV